MRKITKKQKTEARTKTKINIKHYKGVGGGDPPTYKEAVDKIREIFGTKALDNAIKYGTADYIQKLIEFIKAKKREKYYSKMSNREQIEKILHPAFEELLNYIRNHFKITKLGLTVYPLKVFIPRIVNVDKVLSRSKIERILTIAEKKKLVGDELIEEFIQSLEVLKSGFKTALPTESAPYASQISPTQPKSPTALPTESAPYAPQISPTQPKSPTALPTESAPYAPQISPTQPKSPTSSPSSSSSTSSFKSIGTSPSTSSYKSTTTSPSISSYKSTSSSPGISSYKSSKTIRATPYSYLKRKLGSIRPIKYLKGKFGSKKVNPKLVKVISITRSGGRNYKTINKVYSSYKKTRRHNKH
jgi:hypothetical protein